MEKKLLKWRAGDWMREILLSSDKIVELVGDYVYPCVAPEYRDENFYVYSRTEYKREFVKLDTVIQEDTATILLRAVSDDYDTYLTMAELADEVLSGLHRNDDGVVIKFRLIDSKEGHDGFQYFQDLFFAVS